MTTMERVSLLGDRRVGIISVDRPVPGQGEVLVKVAVSALCGSEMRMYRGEGRSEGGNNGHEAAGTVVQLGSGVSELSIGDRVGLSAIVGCGTCQECAAGRYTWCRDWTFVDNMHSEYISIAARACHRLPDDIDWPTGVLISGDGLGVPFHSLTKIPPDARTIAVFGLGPVGLGAVLLHSFLGRDVIGIDLSAERLEIARNLGATSTIQLETDPEAIVRLVLAATNGVGVDVCIEAAGSPNAAKACFAAVRTGGTVVFNGEQSLIELSPSEDFIRRDITASGVWFYHFNEYGPMLDQVRGGLKIADLVTHIVPFEAAPEGFAAMDEGSTGKVLFHFDL